MALTIYILQLRQQKWYVGKTENIHLRYQQHLDGKGSAWTRKYKPVKLEQEIPNASPFDEDKYVKEYMAKYGIDNVRGGTYVSEFLTEEQHNALQQEIWGAQNKCTKCGRSGHFIKNCYAIRDISGNVIENEYEDDDESVWECEKCGDLFEDEEDCAKHERSCRRQSSYGTNTIVNSKECHRCGRTGHYESSCFARTSADGSPLGFGYNADYS